MFGEEYKKSRGEFKNMVFNAFQKIREIRKKNQEDNLEKDKIITKISEELDKKTMENQKLKEIIENCEEKITETYQNKISEQQNQVSYLFLNFFSFEIKIIIKLIKHQLFNFSKFFQD